MTADAFEPKIIGFLCNWCAYEGADGAGRARSPYPSGLHIVRVMCSGRVDPRFILEAFAAGADGVMILGCHTGGCHYKTGNRDALKRKILLDNVLRTFGIGKGRLRLEWIGAEEWRKLTAAVAEMTADLMRMGPLNPWPPEANPEIHG